MLGNGPASGAGRRRLAGLALGITCILAGCGGGGGGDRAAAFSPEVQAANKEVMSGGYRETYRQAYQAKGKKGGTAAQKGK
jgi:hypothetical protein